MKTDMICLVQARAEDAPLAQAMQQVAFAELLERYRDHDMSPATESLEKITWKISHPGSFYYFILANGQTVGAIRVLDQKDGSRKRISPLYIMPDYRGKGYAQAAMEEAERIRPMVSRYIWNRRSGVRGLSPSCQNHPRLVALASLSPGSQNHPSSVPYMPLRSGA